MQYNSLIKNWIITSTFTAFSQNLRAVMKQIENKKLIFLISNNNKTNSLSVNLSVYKLTPKREVLFIPNLLSRYTTFGVRTA